MIFVLSEVLGDSSTPRESFSSLEAAQEWARLWIADEPAVAGTLKITQEDHDPIQNAF